MILQEPDISEGHVKDASSWLSLPQSGERQQEQNQSKRFLIKSVLHSFKQVLDLWHEQERQMRKIKKGKETQERNTSCSKNNLIPACFNIKINTESCKPGLISHPAWSQIFCSRGKMAIWVYALPVLYQPMQMDRSVWATEAASLHFLSTSYTARLHLHPSARLHCSPASF